MADCPPHLFIHRAGSFRGRSILEKVRDRRCAATRESKRASPAGGRYEKAADCLVRRHLEYPR
ncbi:hypothetical protein NITMOv2_1395 [Nitrospira moscoviensis]|uniref:Uncharacterized protein n=1 Tax=Nitrospira moscoviensis TaxID=42253 RepID=A0A0K2GB57_NITMO|nr:hypothetical protein NITMOv2_1395 [Nitrospira moscoviensis]